MRGVLGAQGESARFSALGEEAFVPGTRTKLAALFVFAGWKIRRARLDDREARRIGALQHEAAELMHKLRRDDVPPREYSLKPPELFD